MNTQRGRGPALLAVALVLLVTLGSASAARSAANDGPIGGIVPTLDPAPTSGSGDDRASMDTVPEKKAQPESGGSLLPAPGAPGAPAAAADGSPSIVVSNGVTQPVFDYANAIRERLWVTSDFDSDSDEIPDEIAMDIMRPRETADGLRVPVIMDASPYYTTVCRGNEGECIGDNDGDGINDRWPLFYDNYFVPRGYAMMLLHMVGTGSSTGCPATGGTPDNRSAVMAIDWLRGRRTAHDAAGNTVTASWHNGKTGMIGKSYDGTLANAAAATGVEGLTTIVPISAISSWYFYTRMNGLGLSGWSSNYPSSLANTVTNSDRRSYCAPTRTAMNNNDGDESYDFTPFWFERDYLHDLDKVRASIFVVHGVQDDNVKTDNFGAWWDGLARRNVPRKIWLGRVGHVDPFDFRRAVWVDTLHRWFDYWLQGVQNGIMDEPMATVERDANVFEDYATWPATGASVRKFYMRAGASESVPGVLSRSRQPGFSTTSFTDNTSQSESTIISNPNTVTTARRVFLSAPLSAPLRIAGTPNVNLRASANRVGTSLGAVLVDYGSSTKVTRSGEGISTGTTEDCWGPSRAGDFDACYRQVSKVLTNVTQWRVARGILDGQNRDDLTTPTPLVVDQFYNFRWDLLTDDYVFPAGHQIAVIVVATYSGFGVANTNYGATVTIDLQQTNIELPIVGPVAVDDAATVGPGGSVDIDVLANDSDPEGDTLSVASFTQGAHGAVTQNADGTLRYRHDGLPPGETEGPGTTLYRAASPGDTNIKVVGIPTGLAVADTIHVGSGAGRESVVVTAVGQPASSTTLAALALPGATNIKVASVTALSGGDTITVDTGSFEETRTIQSVGTAGAGGSGVTLTAALGLAHASGAPVTDPGSGITFTPALAQAHASGDPVTLEVESGPQTDSFTYTVSDGRGGEDTATVSITVVNGVPVAVDDAASVFRGETVDVDVLANDTDPDGDTLTVASFTRGAHGTVSENPDRTLRYTHEGSATSSDSFTYTVSDGRGGSDAATVAIRVSTRADLSPTALSLSPAKVEGGDQVTFHAQVANLGETSAENVVVRFLLDGAQLGAERTLAGLAGGASVDVASDTWSAKHQEGTHTIQVLVDPANTVAESNETNNSATATFLVRGNKVTNGSFEQSSSGSSPDNWTSSGETSYESGQSTARFLFSVLARLTRRTAGGAADGLRSVSAGPGGSWASDPVAVEPGRSYEASVQAAGGGGLLVVEQLAANGTVLATTAKTLLPTGSFTLADLPVTALGAATQLRVVLRGGLLGTTTFDDVWLVEN